MVPTPGPTSEAPQKEVKYIPISFSTRVIRPSGAIMPAIKPARREARSYFERFL